MDEKKEQRPSHVPLGTFRSSIAPPAAPEAPCPPAAFADAQSRADETVKTVAVRSSIVGAPPVHDVAERKRVRTLLGVPTPADAIELAQKRPYPSPPKWQSRAPRGDESTDVDTAATVPVARIELRQQPERAGAQTATSGAAGGDTHIADTIQQMLDEQAAVSLEVEDEPAAVVVPPGPRKSSVPPVMLPQHVAIAHAREVEQVAEQVARRSSMPPAVPSPLAVPVVTPIAAPTLDAGDLQRASSLAPAEVKRRTRMDDANPMLGGLMVAAITLVIVGGWFATAGGFQRKAAPAAAAKSVAAAATPVVPAKPAPAIVPAVESPSSAAPTAPTAIVEPQTSAPDAPAAARDKTPAPRAALRTESRVQTPAAPDATRPTMVITPASSASAAYPVMRVTPVAEPAPATQPVQPSAPQGMREAPTRDEVRERIEALRTTITACVAEPAGVADLDVTILGTGTVSNVIVSGDYAGSAAGSCIARAVRNAQFAPFAQSRYRLLYPFKF